MKATDLINEISKIIYKNGDLEIKADNTEYRFSIGSIEIDHDSIILLEGDDE